NGTLRLVLNNMIQDLQTRSRGVNFRQHWITRMSYGRDLLYTPFINVNRRADDTSGSPSLPYVYLYPGNVGSPGNDLYFDPALFSGRIATDLAAPNDHQNGAPADSINNAFYDYSHYSIADQFNHAVRYPDEVAYFNKAVAATPPGKAPPEISLRMLIEQ